MLYELYKNFYFNLYDYLIVAFLINNYLKKKKWAQESPCALRIGSKRSLHLSAPLAFTNIGKNHSFSVVVKFWECIVFHRRVRFVALEVGLHGELFFIKFVFGCRENSAEEIK